MLAVTELAETITATGTAAGVVLAGVVSLVKVWRKQEVLAAALKEVRARLATVESEVTQLRARELKLVAELAEARALLDARDERIAELEAELKEVRARLAELEG